MSLNIKKDLSQNFTLAEDSVAQYGVPRTFEFITLHWWGDPKDKPTFSGTVNYLKKSSSKVSAHFVVSDTQITQLVEEENIAWHSKQANPKSIGIEIDPQFPGKTLETVGELVADICKRRGMEINDDVIKGHRDFVPTACPGTLDINKVILIAKSYDSPSCEDQLKEALSLVVKYKGERDDKDRKYEEKKEELARVQKDYQTNYEQLQKTLSEVNLTNLSLREDEESILEQKNQLQVNFEALEGKKNVLQEALDSIIKQKNKLVLELDEAIAKANGNLYSYSWATRLFSLFRK